jgi:hypothetical protein
LNAGGHLLPDFRGRLSEQAKSENLTETDRERNKRSARGNRKELWSNGEQECNCFLLLRRQQRLDGQCRVISKDSQMDKDSELCREVFEFILKQ